AYWGWSELREEGKQLNSCSSNRSGGFGRRFRLALKVRKWPILPVQEPHISGVFCIWERQVLADSGLLANGDIE
ncbi:MAG: hypothetical protein WBN48_07865, partial [Thiogranum sp.]